MQRGATGALARRAPAHFCGGRGNVHSLHTPSLQHSAFATGGIQGGNTTNAFAQGANTISLFGLSPGYAKFLIDGRPIADYPALYNGTDSFVNISGIPTLLIESIDDLPGAQSSIYGSDAIAGVIDIRLRNKMDGPEPDARYGWSGVKLQEL